MGSKGISQMHESVEQTEHWVLHCLRENKVPSYFACWSPCLQTLSNSLPLCGNFMIQRVWTLGSDPLTSQCGHWLPWRQNTKSATDSVLCFCPRLRQWDFPLAGEGRAYGRSPLFELLCSILSLFSAISCGCFPPGHCGRMSQDSLSPDSSLFSVPQIISFSNKKFSSKWHLLLPSKISGVTG
jgi:hypothetical protein